MIFDVVVEIPAGSRNKYEINHSTGEVRLDRMLFTATRFPHDYGFVKNTLSLDGDPLDILVLASSKTFPGCIVEARVVGYLDMLDNGEPDQKIIGVVNSDPRFSHINELRDIQQHTLREIKHFFKTYKDLQQNKIVEVGDFHDKIDALELIQECRLRYTKVNK